VFDPAGIGSVMLHVEGMGTIAGPPARGSDFDVGSAEAIEQKTVARIVVEMCILVTDRVAGGD
jgi:uncharacterized protein YjlB